MIGMVVFTHGDLAQELARVTAMILGKQEKLIAVTLGSLEDLDAVKARLVAAIAEVNDGDGVVVLTDMFGGTPSNLSLALHAEGKVEVLMGANLPMMLKLASARAGQDGGKPPSLSELATQVAEYGRKNIQAATDILKKKGTPG